MIEVKPRPYNSFVCPECNAEHPETTDMLIEGVHIMSDCRCGKCGFEFYKMLPVGHTVDYPLAYGKTNAKLYDDGDAWVSIGLLKYLRTVKSGEIQIEKVVYKECRDVIILNALDFLYGHTLLKLLNVQYHLDHQKDLGVILIIPKIFQWLIPEGCAEVWIVDVKLSALYFRQEAINNFISAELKRFDKIYLSKAYSHPDFTSIDISRFTGVAPFDLTKFSQMPPHVTFVLREDRWWFENRLTFPVYQFLRKLKLLKWGNAFLANRQNRLVKKTIQHIRRELPSAKFTVVGLGDTGTFEGYAADNRNTKINAAVEIDWCKTYAKSHVVFGVHGSNMLLPTALAAGCVEILPEERYANMVQDLAVRYSDRRQLFFYRFADQYCKPKTVALHILAMINYYDIFNTNMCTNNYR